MAIKMYPVGTKIIYKPNKDIVDPFAYEDFGKKGAIVEVSDIGMPRIYLPESRNKVSSLNRKITWTTRWEHIVPVLLKGQQLLFAFMAEQDV